MPAQVNISILDASNEVGSFSVNTVNITPANLAAVQTGIADVMTALVPLIRGAEKQRSFPVIVRFAPPIPADVEAQREDKWDVTYIDVSPFLDAGNTVANPGYGKPFHVTIPTASRTDNMQSGTDIVDITIGDWPAFVTNFEAIAKSPTGGSVNIQTVKFVGRNN
jgi:hypothetical protein